MKCLAAAAAVLALSASAVSALPSGSNSMSANGVSVGPGFSQNFRKAQAVKALRQEGLKMQEADGGKLSDAHRAELQRKLDHILSGNY